MRRNSNHARPIQPTDKNKTSPAENCNKGKVESAPKARRPSFRLESLEPRILLSGTWVDADTGTSNDGATDGNDIFQGTSSAESAAGAKGDDVLYGNGGHDSLDGGEGNDILYGGDGNDTLQGNEGTDQLFGESGNDKLEGKQGDDTLSGGDGNDELYGNEGNDVLDGGAGNDLLEGGDGTDTADYSSAGSGVSVNLGTTSSQNTVGAGTDTLRTIENLTGSSHDDTLRGNTESNLLTGGAGNDSLYGESGNDTLVGGEGRDRLYGGYGNDTLQGGADHDQLKGGSGNDTLYAGEGNDSLKGGSGDDVLHGEAGNDRLRGDSGNDTLYGGEGNDKLEGGSGNDILQGGDGADRLTGGWGDDTLDGGAGNDTLNGGSGNDTLLASGGSDTMKGGSGDDRFVFTNAQAGDVYTVKGGHGTDTIDLTSFASNQVQQSSGRIDVSLGSGGAFTIHHSKVENIVVGAGTQQAESSPDDADEADSDLVDSSDDDLSDDIVADAGQEQSVNAGDPVTLDGTGSFNWNSSGAVNYEWVQTGGPSVSLSNANAANPTFQAPTVTEPTPITFELRVSDGVNTTTDTVTVTVNNPDPAPSADAGVDQIVSDGATVQLSGVGTDPGNQQLTYEWVQTGGPTVSLSNPTAANPTFQAPTVTDPTTISFELRVRDGVNTTVDTINVNVNPAAPSEPAPTLPYNLSSGPAAQQSAPSTPPISEGSSSPGPGTSFESSTSNAGAGGSNSNATVNDGSPSSGDSSEEAGSGNAQSDLTMESDETSREQEPVAALPSQDETQESDAPVTNDAGSLNNSDEPSIPVSPPVTEVSAGTDVVSDHGTTGQGPVNAPSATNSMETVVAAPPSDGAPAADSTGSSAGDEPVRSDSMSTDDARSEISWGDDVELSVMDPIRDMGGAVEVVGAFDGGDDAGGAPTTADEALDASFIVEREFQLTPGASVQAESSGEFQPPTGQANQQLYDLFDAIGAYQGGGESISSVAGIDGSTADDGNDHVPVAIGAGRQGHDAKVHESREAGHVQGTARYSESALRFNGLQAAASGDEVRETAGAVTDASPNFLGRLWSAIFGLGRTRRDVDGVNDENGRGRRG